MSSAPRGARLAGSEETGSTAARLGEVCLIFALFAVLAGTAPPDVNEAHYLSKARHYWDPAWCQGDLFLESANAHLAFYWLFGWATRCLSLEATAWLGRAVTWWLLAWAWQRLSRAVVPGRLWSLFTAACFATLLRCGHMAGEWVLGGVEAKGFAWVLALLGLEALVRGCWSRTWLWFGAASSFHPLVGGWSVVAGLLAWWLDRGAKPALRAMLPALVTGGVLALPGVVPLLALSFGVDVASLREANELYVHQRLPHHLLFSHILSQTLTLDFSYLGWPPWGLPWTHLYFIRHLVFILLGLGLWRFVDPHGEAGRLYRFVAGSLILAGVGIAIDQATLNLPRWSAELLRYYWFRLSDVMVPLGVAFVLAQTIRKLQATRPALAVLVFWATTVAVLANGSDLVARRMIDPRPPAVVQADAVLGGQAQSRYRDWQQACAWIRQYTPPDSLVLTPRHQQTFKWYAERAEVVSWKDVPQDAVGLLEWKRRMEEVFPPDVLWYGLAAHGETGLLRLAHEYGYDYVLVDRLRGGPDLPFEKVYPRDQEENAWYEVYRLPASAHDP